MSMEIGLMVIQLYTCVFKSEVWDGMLQNDIFIKMYRYTYKKEKNPSYYFHSSSYDLWQTYLSHMTNSGWEQQLNHSDAH